MATFPVPAPMAHGGAFPAPAKIAHSDAPARADMGTEIDSSEFHDSPVVLAAKVDRLAAMVLRAERMVVYSGAGLSTAAGIGDYASKARHSRAHTWDPHNGPHIEYLKEREPTKAHLVLTALERAGMLSQFVNQNHDGLALKACFPMAKLNEIHGSWFDHRNPVVTMEGSMRKDLLDRLDHWTETADLVLSLGTSLSGLYADSLCTGVATRASTSPSSQDGLGLVIVSLTRTPLDDIAALRIYATIDEVMEMLCTRLKLEPYLPGKREVKQASKRSSLFRVYARWYRDVYDVSKYRRETKAMVRARAQPSR